MSAEAQPLQREALVMFERLIDLDPEERMAELEALRAGQPQLHARVAALLAADAGAVSGDFPRGEALRRIDVLADVSTGHAGAVLGPYRLERSLGSGGMGQVWLAQRLDGVSQAPVALKLLHTHLARSALRARFLREGHILGQLAHPHIARLLDAGVAESGQLYLAIEHIDGERIDRWCDQRRLDIPARLRLFGQVCEAVAHAHAHLVVHRDLKPSNILVTQDGSAKLLDFGIAKLIEVDASGAVDPAPHTELTRIGERVMTPEYAAPEQLLGAPVTTATDVYALGAVLYLLLCGRRPHDGVTAAKLERAVIDLDPRPPSQPSGARDVDPVAQDEVARLRATSPRRLREALRGDLDTIVGKALKKAPGERYASVLALAEDIGRHLAQRPVLAQPDTLAYRTRKYLRRNRLALAAAAAVVVTLLFGLAGTLWQARRAEHEAQSAREQARLAHEETRRVKRTKDFFVSVFASASPERRGDDAPVTLVAALDEALKRVDTELGGDPALQGDLLTDLGEIRAERGDYAGSKLLFQRALALQEPVLASDDPRLANTLVDLGVIDNMSGQFQAGQPYLERAVAILERHADTEGEALNNARNGLAAGYSDAGDYARAEQMVRQSLDYCRRVHVPQETRLAVTLGDLGSVLINQDRFDEAQPYLEECVAVVERNQGRNSPVMVNCLVGLGRVALHRQDLTAQAAYAERGLAIARANYAGDSEWTARALAELGHARLRQQRRDEGEGLLRDSLAMFERIGGVLDPRISNLNDLALSREQARDPAQVLALADRGLALCAQMRDADTQHNCVQLRATRARVLAASGPAP